MARLTSPRITTITWPRHTWFCTLKMTMVQDAIRELAEERGNTMDLLTVKETADMLKVSPLTVRRYISTGHLRAVRFGRKIRVQREAVERFVEPVTPTRDYFG